MWLTRPTRTIEVALTLVCGVIIGSIALSLNVFNVPNRITVVVFAALFAVIVVLAIGNVRRLLLAVIFLDLATGTDFNLTCRGDYFMSACGVNFSTTTLALIGLYALWIIAIRRDQPPAGFVRHPHLGLTGKAAVGFILAAGLSLIAARDVGAALYQIWIYLTLFALFFYLANNITTQEELLFIISLLVLGLFIQNVIMELGTLGLFEPGTVSRVAHRVRGTFYSPNNAGGYLAQMFTILLACLALRIPRGQKWFIAGILLFTFYNLVGTESRGGWTSVAIGITIVTLVSLAKRWLDFKSLLIGLIIVIVFALAFSGSIVTRLTSDDNGAADARGPLAEIAFNMIRTHPLVGVGSNNFGIVLYDYVEPEQFGSWLNLVHNGWLLVWSETGTIGFAFYLAFWLTTLWQAVRLIRTGHRVYAVIALGIFASLLGTSTHMMVEIFGARTLWQIIWTEAALVTVMIRLYEQERARAAETTPQLIDPSDVITLVPERKSM